MRFHLILSLCLLWAGASGAVTGAGLEGVSPPPGDLPVPVGVGVYLVDITNIDETRNTFDVELDVTATWRDRRLAFDPVAAGADRQVHVGPAAEKVHQGIWTPQVGLANQVGQTVFGQEKLTVFSDGRVEIVVKAGATCRAVLDFRRFPFDGQVLPITLESYAWNSGIVQLVPALDRTGFAPEFAMAEWKVESFEQDVAEVARLRDDKPFAGMTFAIGIQRQAGYYLWKIFLTVVIIVALTFVVFFMSEERLGRRAGVSSGGILTIIAYQFVTTASLPRVSYLTVADRVMTLSILTVAATMVVSIIVDRIVPENLGLKLRIDRICRWAFPLAYLAILGAVIGRYGHFSVFDVF